MSGYDKNNKILTRCSYKVIKENDIKEMKHLIENRQKLLTNEIYKFYPSIPVYVYKFNIFNI